MNTTEIDYNTTETTNFLSTDNLLIIIACSTSLMAFVSELLPFTKKTKCNGIIHSCLTKCQDAEQIIEKLDDINKEKENV